jgi:DNA-directed RNA polymerase subunit H (RpoH/RPB5)
MAGNESTTPGGKANKGLEDSILSNINPGKIAEILLTLDNAASQMLKQFGQGQAMADILRMSMSESVTSVRKLGGDVADVLKIQQEASKELGRNIVLTEETTKDLYATMQVTGQQLDKIVGGMADAGIGAGKAAGEMLKVVNVARESGVNASAVSSQVLSNMVALNKYNFEGGVQGLAKMAAQATSLRIDMSQTR